MNKTQFIRELQRELGKDVTSRQAEHALNAVLDTIARSVRRRSLVKFRGFGTFRVKPFGSSCHFAIDFSVRGGP